MSGVIKAGSADQFSRVKLWTTADGLPKTNAVFNTAGLSIKYQINNGAVQSVTVGGSPAPASMSAGGAHADWGIYHRGNGWYVIGLADAVLAAAGNRVTVWIELTDCDSAPAEIFVAGYDGSLVAVGASTFDHTSDEVTTDAASRTASQADVSGLASQTSVDTIDGIVDLILADTSELQTNQGNWLTATGFSTHSAADVVTALGTGSTLTDCATADVSGLATAASIAALHNFNPATDTVARVTLVDTTTTNTDMRGTDDAALAATALSTAVWTGTKAGYLDAAISSITAGSGLDAAGVRAAIGLAAANLDTQLSGLDSALGNLPSAEQISDRLERENGSLAKTLKTDEILEFSDADQGQTETHRVRITKVTE